MIDSQQAGEAPAAQQSQSSESKVTLGTKKIDHRDGHAKTLRRGDYGFDSPYVPIAFIIAAVLGLCAATTLSLLSLFWLSLLTLLASILFAFCAASFIWTTRRGKFAVWAELLDELRLRGDEHLLDIGCGRGAVLLLAAERLPAGRAVGLDLWSTTDQSGNSELVTLRNAALEGVEERVRLHTGDMRNLPFPDQSFDVITSSLAIHNIRDQQGRERALSEILRVLKPGGIALIADFRHTTAYQRHFAAQPGTAVERRRLDWRFWYGGPQAATTLVTMRRL
jgi:SAM-dependent methyltransferase